MILQTNSKQRDQLARLMRAEAVGEGNLGMLMVGNVVVNRALANCLTFKDVRNISQVIYQSPGGFTGVDSPLFNGAPNGKERELADRVIKGEYFHPATNALWFYSPPRGEDCKYIWWDQTNIGRYKNHCFYQPTPGICKELH